jgi:hypothetical protein
MSRKRIIVIIASSSLYEKSLLTKDKDLLNLINYYNDFYYKQYGETLEQMIQSEQFKPVPILLLEQRLRKLNLM